MTLEQELETTLAAASRLARNDEQPVAVIATEPAGGTRVLRDRLHSRWRPGVHRARRVGRPRLGPAARARRGRAGGACRAGRGGLGGDRGGGAGRPVHRGRGAAAGGQMPMPPRLPTPWSPPPAAWPTPRPARGRQRRAVSRPHGRPRRRAGRRPGCVRPARAAAPAGRRGAGPAAQPPGGARRRARAGDPANFASAMTAASGAVDALVSDVIDHYRGELDDR